MIQIPLHSEYPSLDEDDFSSQLTKFRDFNIKSKSYHPRISELASLADSLFTYYKILNIILILNPDLSCNILK